MAERPRARTRRGTPAFVILERDEHPVCPTNIRPLRLPSLV